MNIEGEVMTLSDDSSCELPAVELAGTAISMAGTASVKPQLNLSLKRECDGDVVAEDCVDLTTGAVHTHDQRPADLYSRVSMLNSPHSSHIDTCFSFVHREAECCDEVSDDTDCTVELDADSLFDCVLGPASTASSSTASTTSTTTSTTTTTGDHAMHVPRAIGIRVYDKKEERESKRRRVELERAERRTQAELQRAYRPGECMQHMQVEMSPSLCEAWYASDVARELTAARAVLAPRPASSTLHPALVTFTRNIQGQVERSECALLVLEAQRVAELVRERRLADHVTCAAASAPFLSSLTLLIYAPRNYFRETGRKKQKPSEQMTEIELEMAITDLVVCAGVDCARADTPAELALLITHFTKAVAERPYKERKYESDQRAEFYMRGDNRQCVTVDTNGHGLGQLWQQMIAVLPQSSLEAARALCNLYPSPLSLHRECAAGAGDGLGRLAAVGVMRAAAPDAHPRALGPEFARRITTLLTADCGDKPLA